MPQWIRAKGLVSTNFAQLPVTSRGVCVPSARGVSGLDFGRRGLRCGFWGLVYVDLLRDDGASS